MADNEFVVGRQRLGWMIDGDERTPEIPVMAEDTGTELVLTVPTKGMFSDDHYARWFEGQTRYSDDPDGTKYAYKPPRSLLFYDQDGSVTFLGCRATRMRSGMSAGYGVVVANLAILGSKVLDFDVVHGVRTTLPALIPWTGIGTVRITVERDDQGHANTFALQHEPRPAEPLAHVLNLKMDFPWRTNRRRDEGVWESHDVIVLETDVGSARDWDEHFRVHRAVRDLLCLSAWHPFGFSKIHAYAPKAPLNLDGTDTGVWHEVLTHRLPEHKPWGDRPKFLFTYDDIGHVGVRRWLRMNDVYARAMQPLVSLVDQPGAPLETRLLHSGLAIEALGYQLAVEQEKKDPTTKHRNSRGQIDYAPGLRLILEDMKFLPIRGTKDEFVKRSTKCYRAVKHADNEVPDALTLLNSYYENCLVLRHWVAGRLGVKKKVLASRLDQDPMSHERIPVED